MQMARARAAYAAEHMTVFEVLDDDGKVKARTKTRWPDRPGFRQWARERFEKLSASELSPKLARVVGGPR